MVRKTPHETLRDEEKVVRYLKLDIKNQAKVQQLSDLIFGKDYASIEVDADNEEVWIACLDEKPIGFCKYLFNQTNRYYNVKLTDQVYSVLDLVAVLPNYRGHGIATKLAKLVMKGEQENPVFAVAWEITGNAAVLGVFKALGFRFKDNLGHIWKQQCLNNEFQCPAKKDECICTAALYSTV